MIFQLGEVIFKGEFSPLTHNMNQTNNIINYQLLNGGNYSIQKGWSKIDISMSFKLESIENGLSATDQFGILEEMRDSERAYDLFDNMDMYLGKFRMANWSSNSENYDLEDNALEYYVDFTLERTI